MSNPEAWRTALIVLPILLLFVAIRAHFLSRQLRRKLEELERRGVMPPKVADKLAFERTKADAARWLAEAGLPHRTSYDVGPEREAWLPYEADALYNGVHPERIRFGAFLGWPVRCLPALAEAMKRMSAEEIAGFGLVMVDHQAAGHHCFQFTACARPAAIAPDKLDFARGLCAHFFHYRGGYFIPTDDPEVAADYRTQLAAGGVFGDRVLARPPLDRGLMEGVYPVDADQGQVARLLLAGEEHLERLAPLLRRRGLRNELTLYLIADNSD